MCSSQLQRKDIVGNNDNYNIRGTCYNCKDSDSFMSLIITIVFMKCSFWWMKWVTFLAIFNFDVSYTLFTKKSDVNTVHA